MQTEPMELLELVPEIDTPIPVEALPVIPYSSRNNFKAGPSALDILKAAAGIILAVTMAVAAGMIFVWIFQLANDGSAFSAFALLVPLGLLLMSFRTGYRMAARNLRGAGSGRELRGEEAIREWRDVVGGICATIFGLTLFEVMLLLAADLAHCNGNPKRAVAVVMMLIILLRGIERSFRSAWRRFGAASRIKEMFSEFSRKDA